MASAGEKSLAVGHIPVFQIDPNQSGLLDRTFCILLSEKQKEALPMKQHTMSRPSTRRCRAPAYPNAADRRYFVEKAVNIVTAILSGIGFVSAMVFLATMG